MTDISRGRGPRFPRRRALWLTFALCLAIVLGGEVVVRAAGSTRSDGAISPLLFYPHVRLPRALVRGATDGERIRVNRHGFRGPRVSITPTPGITRVLVLGASTTFDPCAPHDSLTWPAQLEKRLSMEAPGRRFEVINAGVPRYEMVDQNVRLLAELHEFQPDVVLLYAGHGVVNREHVVRPRALRAESRRTPAAAPASTPWSRWLSRNSLLYHKVVARLRRVRTAAPAEPTRAQWDSATANAQADFRTQLKAFGLIAKSFGARVVFVELAHVGPTGPGGTLTPADRERWWRAYGVPPEVVLEGYRRFGSVWRTVAADLDATFISRSELGIRSTDRFCLPDPIHFNAVGSREMGARLADLLLASAALEETPASVVD